MKAIPVLKKFLAVLVLVAGASLCGQAQEHGPSPAPTPSEITPLRMTVVEEPSALSGWKHYQFGDPTLFSGILPAAPIYQSEKFPVPQGSLVTRVYMAASASGVYGLNYIESPLTSAPGQIDAQTKTFFNNYMKGFIDGFKRGLEQKGFTDLETKTGPERKVRISGLDGFEQDLTIGPFEGRTQVVFIGRKVYAAVALWRPESPANERTAFFNSFQVRAKR
jgi:hypothetical protein